MIYYNFGPNSPANDGGYALAQAVNKYTRYQLEPDDGTSFGGYKDWAIEKKHIPSLTIEVGKGKSPVHSTQFPQIWRENKNVPYAVAEWVKKA